MAEKYRFFNSKNGDRKYSAEDWADYFCRFFKNGVFNGQLQVVANTGMSVTLKKGCAWIEGYLYQLTEDIILDLDTASGSLNRYDTVVIRLDKTERHIRAFVKKGNSAEKPEAPEVTRSDKAVTYELQLAKIYLAAGTIDVSQHMITDTRMDKEVCGWVCGTVEEIDFGQITIQFSDFLRKFEADNLDGFLAWFGNVKNQLSEDAAGNLQLQVDELRNTAFLKTGGTVSGLTTFQQGSIAHEYIHSVGTGGFLKLATFKVTEQFDFPVEFYLAELSVSGNIYIRFAKDGNGYSLAEFAYSGNIDTLNPHMHQSDADTWDFYIWVRGWSAISVSDLKINKFTIQKLNNGKGIIWHYGPQNVFTKYPSGAVAPKLMTYNIKLKDTDSLWMEIYNLKGQMLLKNYVKQVEVIFNNSVSSAIMTNSFLAGSALDINEITIQGIICTGIGAMLDACFSTDKSQILFYLNNNSGYTGTLKANIILLYSDGTLVAPDDPISGGEIPV